MNIDGTVAIVTGGGSGIGRALTQAFAAAGARVVAGDIDESGAAHTAALAQEAGGTVVGVAADAGAESGIARLITVAEQEFGPVDIYVANAGVMGAPELGGEDDWDRILDVNLLAHVRAARMMLPQWQSRGSGYFVAVTSAAGLLSQIGAAGYAVTKHAAVGFAEWLALTYGDDGIGVSCVCPLGVETALLDGARAAQSGEVRRAAQSITQSGAVISPQTVAELTVAGVLEDRFLILPHPEVLDMYRKKGADYQRWIDGMRRYRRSLS